MVASADLIQVADRPIRIDPGRATADRIFHISVRSVAALVLVIFGSIGVFLAYQAIPTYHRYGIKFLTGSVWSSTPPEAGIASTLVGTVKVALVALVVAFPLAMACALYISEYSPPRLKSFLIGLVDLMAAVPSVVYGAWGLLLIMPYAKLVSRWMAQYLGWIPFLRVNADPSSATWAESRFVNSPFIAGIIVSMMIIPIAASVMRTVFSQAPLGEREAALALGATRWGMIRAVVLPFGRGGIIGGTMLGLGRALGETIAVVLIVSLNFGFNFRILQGGFSTISSLIANDFNDATQAQLSALLTAGFVLFVMTLMVNTVAAVVVSRSRSGAATEI